MKTKTSRQTNGLSAPARRESTASEREWLRAALHDGLGQLLTSISFLASSLNQKLAAQKLPEAAEAAEILSLAGRAICETNALVQEKKPVSGSPTAGRAARP